MSRTERAGGPAAPEGPVLARLATRVRPRFRVDMEDLATRVQELANRRQAGVSLETFIDALSLDDLYLATACAADDEPAWNEFGTRFFGFIRDFARRVLRDPGASDVADQVIADLWQRKKLARYEGRSSLRTWLGAIVAHAAINAAKQARTGTVDERGIDALAQPDWQDASKGLVGKDASTRLVGWVDEAIRGLSPDSRLLIFLYYEQSLTLAEMSAAVHLSTAALSRKLDRTRRELRQAVERLAVETTGASADTARASLDLGQVELDLSAIFRERNAKAKMLSKA
jgi:RNA polymerase sigma-70 factor (ECF subfamily)